MSGLAAAGRLAACVALADAASARLLTDDGDSRALLAPPPLAGLAPADIAGSRGHLGPPARRVGAVVVVRHGSGGSCRKGQGRGVDQNCCPSGRAASTLLLSLSSPFWTMPTEQPTAAADDGLPRDADGNKIKPCCACPETRKPRDEWQVRWQWQHLLPRSKVSPSPCPSLPLPPRQHHGEGRAGVCRPHRGAQGGFW